MSGEKPFVAQVAFLVIVLQLKIIQTNALL